MRSTSRSSSAAQVRFLSDRHFGVGCDQLLVVEAPSSSGVDFRYRIYNADGGEVEQCGNGARCFVRFVHDKHLSDKREIRVETRSGVISPRLESDGKVTVDMGVPVFEPRLIPFVSDSAAVVQPLEVSGRSVPITAVSMGNPHAVQVVADVDAAPVARRGRRSSLIRVFRAGQCRFHAGARSTPYPAAGV